mmetsp:Transcript_5906/g.16620  ORF Transcript_5906/g.16620 Transcript_5906/m.16620 type:complete len:364 (+) Transcript_5906:139-1230(+)
MTKLASSTSGASSTTSAAAKVLLALAASTCVCCTSLHVPTATAFVHIPTPVTSSTPLSALRSDRHGVLSLPSSSLMSPSASLVRLQARRRRRSYDDDDDEDLYYNDDNDGYVYDDEDDYYDEEPRRRRGRRRPVPSDDLGTAASGSEMQVPSPFGLRSGLRLPDSVSKAVLAGIFVLGIGTGVTIDSQINTSPKDLASRDAIDQNAPNPIVCARYGASAMAFDQRVFVSFNPFNVYVAQADVKPACVLRQSNVVQVLEQSGLINDSEVRSCKRNMNTWAFVGELDDKPQLSCVYQSEDAQNEFLSNPKLGIGEDVYDDDRAQGATKKSTGKLVKGGGTEAQQQQSAAAAAAARKIAQETPPAL